MGVQLVGVDSAPPAWPAIFCAGGAGDVAGRGWAWHEDIAKRACFGGLEIAAPADVVASAIDGRELAGVDRALAIVALRDEVGTGSLRRIFRHACPQCGGNHSERATAALRAMRGTPHVSAYVQAGAVEHLRRARVPERYLYQPRLIRPRQEQSGERYGAHLPVVVGDSERTRLAQIAFALRYEASKRPREASLREGATV